MLNSLTKMLDDFIHWWNQFFFNSSNPNIGICRALLGINIFYLTVMKSFNLDFFNDSGIVTREHSMSLIHELMHPLISWTFWPDRFYLMAHIAVLILSALFALGFLGRLLTWALFTLYMGFLFRNYAILFGADILSGLFLFYFCLMRSSQTFSAWSLMPVKPTGLWTSNWDTALTSVGYRLLQIQIVVIYTYTGFEKLRGQSWWNGTALWTVVSNPQMVIWDLTWMRHFPLFIGAMTFSAIFFEVSFGWAMITPKLRPTWLCLGILFHFMIGITMGLVPFSLVMLSVYPLFLHHTPRFYRSS